MIQIRLIIAPACLALLCLLAGCASVHIETGGTVDEAVESSNIRGKGIRSEWAGRLDKADPVGKADILRSFIDSVSVRYIRYGYQIEQRWREGSEGRNEEIPDTEIRQYIDSWTAADQPVFESYEDVIDYGFEQIRLSYFFDLGTEQILSDLRDHYTHVQSYVFYPNGNRADYEYGLEELKLTSERLSRRLLEDLNRYR